MAGGRKAILAALSYFLYIGHSAPLPMHLESRPWLAALLANLVALWLGAAAGCLMGGFLM